MSSFSERDRRTALIALAGVSFGLIGVEGIISEDGRKMFFDGQDRNGVPAWLMSVEIDGTTLTVHTRWGGGRQFGLTRITGAAATDIAIAVFCDAYPSTRGKPLAIVRSA